MQVHVPNNLSLLYKTVVALRIKCVMLLLAESDTKTVSILYIVFMHNTCAYFAGLLKLLKSNGLDIMPASKFNITHY